MKRNDFGEPGPNGSLLSVSVRATEGGVRVSLGQIRRYLLELGVGRDEADTAELVLGEAMNNVVEHALITVPNAEFSVEVSCGRGVLACRIVDAGREMPGLVIPKGRKLEVATELDGLPEGGFGWMLIRELTQRLTYSRSNGKNCLEFDLLVATAS